MSEKEQAAEYRKEWTLTVLKLISSRQSHLNETLRLTKEIGEALDRNDRVSVQMLLEMRGNELEQIDEGIRKLQLFKETLPVETRQEIDVLLTQGIIEERNEFSEKLVEIAKSCKKTLDDIIVIDRRMSKRIAGSDSFYK